MKIFFIGMLISFAGTLPPGTANITAVNLALFSGSNAAIIFAVGCIAVETVCLVLVLICMKWISKRTTLFRFFEFTTIILILLLAAASLLSAVDIKPIENPVISISELNPFLLGVFISIINPLHIPFWLGWTTMLTKRNILTTAKSDSLFYTTGITAGTACGFGLFIYGGNFILYRFDISNQLINTIIGSALLVTAFVQLFKMKYKAAM